MLQINLLHCTFLIKKIKNIHFCKLQSCGLYSILVKKVNFFFIMVLRKLSCILTNNVNSNLFFVFKFKIPSKLIFNLILMEVVNLVNCLNVPKTINFSSFSKRQTIYSLLRSPFVYKKSQEQVLFDFYTGTFLVHILNSNAVIVEYIEFFLFKNLKKLSLLDVKIFKTLNVLK